MRVRRHESVVRRQINRYVGACEGSQEKRYFDHLKQLIRGIPDRDHDVDFAFAATKGGSPLVVARRAHGSGSGRNPVVAVFDYDGRSDEFAAALDYCKINRLVAGYSNYCFDLWLLLHKRSYSRLGSAPKEYAEDLRAAFGLPLGAEIKDGDTLNKIMGVISLSDVRSAIERAESIEANNKDTRQQQTSVCGLTFYHNPDLSIHRFVRTVLESVYRRRKR